MKSKLSLLIITTMLSANAYAGVVIPPPNAPLKSNTDTENRAYAGLVWTLQDKMSFIPNLTIGLRSLRVKSSDSVQGADISTRVKLTDGISFDSTRLSYIGGNRDILGNIGVGYSHTNSSLLGTLTVQGPYSKIGSDYAFSDRKFVPYLELLTVDSPNKVNKKQ